MTKKMGVNAALNLFKTALSIIFPLITYPYISRILGVENLGKINYTASIVGYFSLINLYIRKMFFPRTSFSATH